MIRATYYGATDIGKIRKNNEDNFVIKAIWDDRHLLCAVIDGLGGYEGGEVAAEIARETIVDFLENSTQEEQLKLIKEAVLKANNRIVSNKTNVPQYARMGCVMTAALIDLDAQCIYLAHVGDTRLYEYDGSLRKLTHDHSLVGYREEIGALTELEAMNHPMRNELQRYIGDEMHGIEDENFIEASVYPITSNTQLLFCSDGLCDMVTQAEMSYILAEDVSVEEKCQQLIEKANQNGGKDNVTVIVLAFGGESKPIPTPENNVMPEQERVDIQGKSLEPAKKDVGRERILLVIAVASIVSLLTGFFCGYEFKAAKTSSITDSLKAKDAVIREYRDFVVKHHYSSNGRLSTNKEETDSLINENEAE